MEFLNRNICLEFSASAGGSLKRWEEREGKLRGKERESTRGWEGGMGGLEGSKPQNWDVILLRVCAERFGWAGGRGVPAKAGWAGQPCKPRAPPKTSWSMVMMVVRG